MKASLTKKKLREARAHLRNARPGTFLAWLRLSEIDAKTSSEKEMDRLLDEWNAKARA